MQTLYAPYPKIGNPVGVGFTWSDSKWRWFVVHSNGTPIAQRGPVWLSEDDAQQEAANFLESTQGRGYIGTVARWDWNPNTRQWNGAVGGMLGAAPIRDRLLPGEELTAGQELRTSNGGRLIMQADGNFVLYAPDGHPIWATDTYGKPVTRAVMQKDGNLVMRSPLGYGGFPEGQGWWDSGTKDRGVTQLVLQTDGNLVWYKGDAAAANAISNTGTHNWAKSPHWQQRGGNILKDIVKVVTAPVTATIDITSKIEHAVEKVPVLGDVTRIVADTATAPLRVATAAASGARLDHVALGAFKDQLKIARETAPYAQTVVSFIPGIGTGAAAAIAGGIALAEGQSITEIGKAAIRGALPGGPLAAAAFDTAIKVAAGENVGLAALESARGAIPAGAARTAFDVGVAVATGEKIQTALAKGLSDIAPGQMQAILSAGQQAIGTVPGLANALKSVTPGAAAQGFTLAAGLLSHSGMNEKALTAVRAKLAPELRQGFDAALRTQEPSIAWLKNVTSPPAAVAAAAPAPVPAAPQASPPPKINEPTKRVVAAPPPKAVAPAAAAAPKIVEPTKKGTAPTRATASVARYAPYPKQHGVGAPPPPSPPHGGHGGPHGGGGHHDGHGRPFARPGARRPGWRGSWWEVPWTPDLVVTTETCRTWGDPIEMPPAMQTAAKAAMGAAGMRPTTVRGPDGGLYLFALENGIGSGIIARPCASVEVTVQ